MPADPSNTFNRRSKVHATVLLKYLALLLGPEYERFSQALRLSAEGGARDVRASLEAGLALADRLQASCLVRQHTHDLRSPLNGLSLNLQLLAQDLRAGGEGLAESAALVAALRPEVDSLARGLEQLDRAFESSCDDLGPLDLTRLSREVCGLVVAAYGQDERRLEFDDDAPPVRVIGNQGGIVHAMLHVLLEAPGPDRHVRVTVQQDAREGRVVVSWGQTPAAPASPSTLAPIVRQLIALQGGRVSPYRDPLEGRVEIVLPAHAAPAS